MDDEIKEHLCLGHKGWRLAALRRGDAACVADAPRCHDCGRAAERVDDPDAGGEA